MNGVHDLGGMDGFGAVRSELNEPVFHEPWEGRVFALNMLGAGRTPIPVDALRHRIERLDPVRYLASSYYARWLAAMAEAIIDAATLTPDEIEARMRELEAEPDRAMPQVENPAHAEGVVAALRAGSPVTRKIRKPARFAIGDHVLTRNLNPLGHTRLPRYARGKRAVIALHHGAHVFPDTNAHGLGEHPQHLYTVRFAARELWGNAAEPKATVLIDLWESYLDGDRSVGAVASMKAKAPAKRIPKTASKSQPKTVTKAKPAAKAQPKASSARAKPRLAKA
ncbi:MAG: nitrile hydratase subunit beta, partial [Gammaproteobacteria bacterium]